MRAAFYTLGCKVNQYETSVLVRQFREDGFEIVEPTEPADVYVVNSCTVTAAGDKKTRQLLRRFRRQSPGSILALCGCFPQAFPQEAGAIPEADIVAGASRRGELLGLVRQRLMGTSRIVRIVPHRPGEPFEAMRASSFGGHTRAFVKIQDGCQRRCTYCIIPRARGEVRSKKPADLRGELTELGLAGYREVVLSGINLSCYGQDFGGRLLDAVSLACAVPGIRRVRLGSLEPELLTPADIEAMAGMDKLCPQFHLSLQSGCDRTLRRMGRHYDTAEYRRIAADLRGHFQNAAITTDMMVGFPGETASEFEQSAAFAREIGFARIHVFAYSRREGTPAAGMPEQVPAGEKSRRSHILTGVARELQREFLHTQAGGAASVLLETSPAPGQWEGYTANYTPVRVAGKDGAPGQIRTAILTGVERDRCTGWLRPIPSE